MEKNVVTRYGQVYLLSMTMILRIFFVFYIALLSSFDTALAEEFEEIDHMFTHDHSSARSNNGPGAGLIVLVDVQPNDGTKTPGWSLDIKLFLSIPDSYQQEVRDQFTA